MRLYGIGVVKNVLAIRGRGGEVGRRDFRQIDGIATPNLPSPQTTLPPHPPMYPSNQNQLTETTKLPCFQSYLPGCPIVGSVLSSPFRSNTPNTA